MKLVYNIKLFQNVMWWAHAAFISTNVMTKDIMLIPGHRDRTKIVPGDYFCHFWKNYDFKTCICHHKSNMYTGTTNGNFVPIWKFWSLGNLIHWSIIVIVFNNLWLSSVSLKETTRRNWVLKTQKIPFRSQNCPSYKIEVDI